MLPRAYMPNLSAPKSKLWTYAVSVRGDLTSLASLMWSALGCRDRTTLCVQQWSHDLPRHGVSLASPLPRNLVVI